MSQKPNKTYPLKVAEYQSGYYSYVAMVSYVPSKRFYDKNHHETFNYQGVNYYIHNPYEMVTKFAAKHQTIANYSMIVYLNPQKTIIDDALKSYEPKRLLTDPRFQRLNFREFQTRMLPGERKAIEVL
jgi:hypothetical protein